MLKYIRLVNQIQLVVKTHFYFEHHALYQPSNLYLYNKSVELLSDFKKGITQKLKFKYKNKKGSEYLIPRYVAYYDKKLGVLTTSCDGSNTLLELLSNLPDRRVQSYALLGLALHILQDYYAHLTYIIVQRRIHRDYVQCFGSMNSTEFSNDFLNNTAVFEDNINIMPWRYSNAQSTTKTVVEYYQKGWSIGSIKEKQFGGYITFRFTYRFKYYDITYRKYYLKINL